MVASRVCLSVAFLITMVALLAVLVWREVREKKDTLEKSVRKKYPGYFRTLEEQKEIEDKLRQRNKLGNHTSVNRTIVTNHPCSVNCHTQSSPGQRKRRAVDTKQYHGCCVSDTVTLIPSQRVNICGVQRTFVQFGSRKQFFMVHECSQDVGCTGGNCEYLETIHTAVVYKHGVIDPDDSDHVEIDYFYFNGCCKSIND